MFVEASTGALAASKRSAGREPAEDSERRPVLQDRRTRTSDTAKSGLKVKGLRSRHVPRRLSPDERSGRAIKRRHPAGARSAACGPRASRRDAEGSRPR